MGIKRMARGVLLAASLAGILAISAVPGQAVAIGREIPPTRLLRIQPGYGPAGAIVQVSGVLLGCSQVSLSWNQGASRSARLGTAKVLNGAFGLSVTIPSSAASGPSTITSAGAGPRCSASGTFFVVQNRTQSLPDPGALTAVFLSPTLGPPGAPIQVHGSGFQCGAQVFLYWHYAQGPTDYLTSAAVNYGTFNTSITVPRDAPDGTSQVRAVATAPGCSAQATFTVCRFCQEGALEPDATR
jgi:hypothetical protein